MINGFEPMETPTKWRSSKWRTRETVDAFLASGELCVGRDYGDQARKAYQAFRICVKRSKAPVTVTHRGAVVMLLRKER